MKKILSLIVAMAIIATFAVTASGCKPSGSTSRLNYKDAYALGVIAGSSYFNAQDVQAMSDPTSDSVVSSAVDASNASSSATASRPTAVENDIPDFNKYVKMFEGYLLNGETGVTDVATDESVIGKVYGSFTVTADTKIQKISLPMLSGENVEYIMYYNETVKGASDIQPMDDDDDDKDDKDDKDDNETEEHAVLTGVVVLADETFYEVSGERSTESEDFEKETEFTFIIKKNDSSYIKMEHSTEIEPGESENELMFSLYENGNLVSSTEIEFEKEDGKVEMELEFNDDVASAKKVTYKVELTKDGDKNVLTVTYKTSDETGKFKIKSVNDKYEYSYANGYTEQLDK